MQVEIHYKTESKPNSRDHLDFIVPNYDSKHIGGIFGRLQTDYTYFQSSDAQIVMDKKRNKTFLMYK